MSMTGGYLTGKYEEIHLIVMSGRSIDYENIVNMINDFIEEIFDAEIEMLQNFKVLNNEIPIDEYYDFLESDAGELYCSFNAIFCTINNMLNAIIALRDIQIKMYLHLKGETYQQKEYKKDLNVYTAKRNKYVQEWRQSYIELPQELR